MTAMIEFTCNSCATRLGVPDEKAGKKGACPNCGLVLEVPAQSAVAVPARAPTGGSEPADALAALAAETLRPAGPRRFRRYRKKPPPFGTVSFGIGVFVYLVCWIPLVCYLTIPLSVTGVALGILGVAARGRRGTGGIVLSVLGIILNGMYLIFLALTIFLVVSLFAAYFAL
jgi:hypothetical protein